MSCMTAWYTVSRVLMCATGSASASGKWVALAEHGTQPLNEFVTEHQESVLILQNSEWQG